MAKFANVIYIIGILGLFWLERDRSSRTSRALWIPVIWMSIAGSRNVSQWLQVVQPSPDGNTFDHIIISALLVFGISVLIIRGPKVKKILQSNRTIILFILYCAVSIFWSEYPTATFTRWFKVSGDLLMVLIILTDPAPIEAVERSLSRVSFILLPLSILFIKFYPELGRYYDLWEGVQFYSGVAADKNMLGMTCMAFVIVSAWRILEAFRNGEHKRKGRLLIAHGIVLAMALNLFLQINSMTSLFSFLAAISLIAATKLFSITKRAWVLHLIFATLLVITSSVLFFGIGGGILSSIGRDHTLTGRTDLWNVLYGMNPNPILGAGFEAFWRGPRLQWLAQTIGAANEAHNGYLEVFLNLGWIGVGLVALIIAVGYRNIFITFGRDPSTARLWLAYFVSVLVYSCTEAAFRVFTPVWITFLLAIVGSSVTSKEPKSIKRLFELRVG